MEERLDAPNDAATHDILMPRNKRIGVIGEYDNHNNPLRDAAEENNDSKNTSNINETELTRKQRAWIQEQKQTIHKEDAAQHTSLQNEDDSSIKIEGDENEAPQPYGCTTDMPLPTPERIDDAAAISVMIYLLVIAFLLALAILIGTVVVSQYGFIVFVAVVVAIGAMLLVALVVISVIQGDRKLTKARKQIHKWSMEVKAVIMKEVADLKEDYANYSSGMLLLTYEGELFSATPDYVRDGFDNKGIHSKRRRKPKSIIFRLAISPLKKLGRKNQTGTNSNGAMVQKKSNKQESGAVATKKRSWFGSKKKKTTTDVVNYEEGSPSNYHVSPSGNLEIV